MNYPDEITAYTPWDRDGSPALEQYGRRKQRRALNDDLDAMDRDESWISTRP